MRYIKSFLIILSLAFYSSSAAHAQNVLSKNEIKISQTIKKERPNIKKGRLAGGKVSSVIKKARAEITYCYEELLKRKPTAEGKVVISFTITKDGKVKNAHVSETTFVSHDVPFCVAKIIGSLKFEKPKSGEVLVKKTFVFEVGDEKGKKKRSNLM